MCKTHFCSSQIKVCFNLHAERKGFYIPTCISLVPSLAKSIRQIGCSKDQFVPLNTGVFGCHS